MKVVAAERLKKPPFALGVATRGLHRRGLNYELKVAAMLKAQLPLAEIEHGAWFRYKLEGKLLWRFCQPDFIIRDWIYGTEGVKVGQVTVAECKLSWRSQAVEKLHALYIPVVQMALGLPSPPLAMQICGNINRRYSQWQADPDRKPCALLHWRGDGFRLPRAKKAKRAKRRAA